MIIGPCCCVTCGATKRTILDVMLHFCAIPVRHDPQVAEALSREGAGLWRMLPDRDRFDAATYRREYRAAGRDKYYNARIAK